jgi:pyruvate kinase
LSQIIELQSYKKTKILATIGPGTNSPEAISKLIKAGANGLRLNFSHGTHQEKEDQIKWILKAEEELNKPVSIVMDLQGPKIRLGDFDGVIELTKGQTIVIGYKANYAQDNIIPIQYDLSSKVKKGDRIYLFDGKIKTQVLTVKGKLIYLRVANSGQIIKRKGINLPDTELGEAVITAKDKVDLVFGSNKRIDYVAQSFVQSAQNVRALRRLLNSLNFNAKIIVKFETQSAVDNLEEIIDESDVVMVARGDLAYEVLPEAVPLIQRRIIKYCQQTSKPVIVATQMLYSMTTSREPTRAEVSDIAGAVLSGADCLMLSDETANGSYPTQAVKLMKKVILYTEQNREKEQSLKLTENSHNPQKAISKAVVALAQTISAQAIVAETKSGATALNIAALRPDVPLIAVTNDPKTYHQMALVYGVKSYLRPIDKFAATKLTDWLRQTRILNKGDIVVSASGKYPGVVGTTDTIKVRILDN